MSKKIQIPNPIKVVETGTPTTENLVKGQVAIKEEDGKLVLFGNTGGEKIQSTAPQKYDYQKLISLTEESSDADIRAALTPIGGTEVVWPNIGDEVVSVFNSLVQDQKGSFISVINETARYHIYFIYQYIFCSITVNFRNDKYSITEFNTSSINVKSKFETIDSELSFLLKLANQNKADIKKLKPMYDFAKINALTGESGNDEIEAAIKQLQTSTTTAPSAGALLVDATSLAPLAVVTDSSSNAPSMTEVFSYTHGGVKYTVEISGEQGALTAKVTTQAVMQRRYDYSVWVGLNDTSQMDECIAALTPIGETAPAWPKVGDLLCDASDPATARSVFASVTPIGDTAFNFLFLSYLNDSNAFLLNIAMQDNEDGTYSVTKANDVDITSLQSTVTQQGTQIQSNTKNINGLHKMDVISDSVQVVFKQYMSRETGKEEKEFMIQAPKGMLSGEEKVKLYRKLATRYKVKDDIAPYEHRVKSGWIGYKDENSGDNGSKLYELEAVPFKSSNPSPYHDYFRIVWKRFQPDQSIIKYTFDEILRSKCTLVMDEDTGAWKHVRIENGRKAKKLLNYSNDLGFKIPVSFVTWGVQLTTNKGEAYTPIMPFKVRYQMGNPAHQGKFTEKEAAEFTLGDLYISMSK